MNNEKKKETQRKIDALITEMIDQLPGEADQLMALEVKDWFNRRVDIYFHRVYKEEKEKQPVLDGDCSLREEILSNMELYLPVLDERYSELLPDEERRCGILKLLTDTYETMRPDKTAMTNRNIYLLEELITEIRDSEEFDEYGEDYKNALLELLEN